MPASIIESVGAELVRRDVRSPRLRPGERILLDFEARPRPGDLCLVHTGRVFAVERWRSKRCRPAWLVAVVRSVTAVVALLAMID